MIDLLASRWLWRLGPWAAGTGGTVRFRRLVAVLALVAPVAACEVTLQEEDELGDQYAAAIRRELPIVEDTAVTRALTRLGRQLVPPEAASQRDWHYYVVNDTMVNAFAVPGGHIFVNRGLIEAAGSHAELAGVLGHEIAHVTLRHSVDQMRSRQRTNVLLTLVCAVVSICESTAAQIAIGVGGQMLFAKYSREDEAEADSAALGYLARAGVDPRGVPAMFERLLAQRRAEPSALQAWFGSHPVEEDRVARTRALIARLELAGAPASSGDDPSFAELKRSLAALPLAHH